MRFVIEKNDNEQPVSSFANLQIVCKGGYHYLVSRGDRYSSIYLTDLITGCTSPVDDDDKVYHYGQIIQQ